MSNCSTGMCVLCGRGSRHATRQLRSAHDGFSALLILVRLASLANAVMCSCAQCMPLLQLLLCAPALLCAQLVLVIKTPEFKHSLSTLENSTLEHCLSTRNLQLLVLSHSLSATRARRGCARANDASCRRATQQLRARSTDARGLLFLLFLFLFSLV